MKAEFVGHINSKECGHHSDLSSRVLDKGEMTLLSLHRTDVPPLRDTHGPGSGQSLGSKVKCLKYSSVV